MAFSQLQEFKKVSSIFAMNSHSSLVRFPLVDCEPFLSFCVLQCLYKDTINAHNYDQSRPGMGPDHRSPTSV